MHLGFPPQAKRFPTLAKSPQLAALQAAHSQGEDTAGFKFYPVLERPDPNDPGMQQRFHEKIPFKTLKEVKQACTVYGPTVPFTLRLLQSVVGDTAMTPDNWRGLAKVCLTPGDYLLWKTGFIGLCQDQANLNLAHGLHMLMGRGPFEGIDNQLQYPPQAYQQITIAGTRAWQELPIKGKKTLELTSILQGPEEPYQELVARLLQDVGWIVADAETRNIWVKQLAFKNAQQLRDSIDKWTS
jgi:hypothetical protein